MNLDNAGDPNSGAFWRARFLECLLLGPNCGRGFELLSLSPTDGSSNVPAGIPIRLQFSTPVNLRSLSMQSENGNCSGTFQISKDDFNSCLGGVIDSSSNPIISISPYPGNVCISTNNIKIKVSSEIEGLNGTKLSQAVQYQNGYNTGEPKIIEFPALVNSSFRSIEVYCNHLFMAGNFNGIGNYEPYFAIVSKSSNTSGLNMPSPNSAVDRMVADPDGGLWLAGSFTSISDKGTNYGRTYLAKINADGSLSDASFNISGQVTAMAINGDRLIIGGNFTTVNGSARNYLAEINRASNTLTSWNPGAGTNVVDIEFYGGNIYALLASLSTCGSNVHNTGIVCRLTPDSNTADVGFAVTAYGTTENPRDFAVSEYGIFIAADDVFGSNYGIGKFSVSTGAQDASFNPFISGESANSVYINNSSLYVVGNFNSAFSTPRKFFMAYNLLTGYLVSGDPIANKTDVGSSIEKIHFSNGNLYLSGSNLIYNKTDEQTIKNLLKVNLTDLSIDQSFELNPNSYVQSLIESQNNIILAGGFLYPRMHSTSHFGAIDLSTGLADKTIYANLSAELFAMIRVNDRLYLGGGFQKVNNKTQPLLAAYNIKQRKMDSWNANISAGGAGFVLGMYATGEDLYVGGNFSSVGGESHSCLAKVKEANGAVDSNFTATAPSNVRSFYKTGNLLYVGGDFPTLNAQANRGYLGVVTADTGTLDPLLYQPNSTVFILKEGPNSNLFVGGTFATILSTARAGLASIQIGAANLLAPNIAITPAGSIYDFLVDGRNIYVGGGSFTSFNAESRSYFASFTLNSDNSMSLKSLIANTNGEVRSIKKNGNYLYLGGLFTTVNGLPNRSIYQMKLTE